MYGTINGATVGKVEAIYRYPVKGLTAHALTCAQLTTGGVLPFDRAYAIENGPGRFDESNPKTLDRIAFLMLLRDERLAALEARFDDQDQTLTIFRSGKQVARGNLNSTAGRAILEQFFAAYMRDELRGAPKIRHADGHSFADASSPCVHLINLESLHDLERVIGRPLNPLRFRPNFVVSGIEAWQEDAWVGRDIEAGSVRLQVFERTQRCAATNVDPETASRDLDIPATLMRRWGHSNFGVYARVVDGGTVATGNAVHLV